MGASGELQASAALNPGKNNGMVQGGEQVGRRACQDIFENTKSLPGSGFSLWIWNM